MDDRVSSEEFTLHQAFWRVEPDDITRWAALMAATANGPLVKRDKRKFTVSDFWPPDVWDPPVEEKVKPGKPMAPDFSHLRGLKVGKAKRG